MAKKPRKKYSRGPTATDIHVGSQIRTRRILLGLSQEKLADGLDITFQQVQKYERGSDRVSASRLYYIAQLLNVPVAWFFEDLDGSSEKQPLSIGAGLPDNVTSRKETLKLLRYYYALPDQADRDQFRDLLKCIGKAVGDLT